MVDLVIKDEGEMTRFLEFLIISLQSVNGIRNSGKDFLDSLEAKGKKNAMFGSLIKKSQLRVDTEQGIDLERFLAEQSLYLSAFRIFNLKRIRMKISYMALLKKKTIQELFFEAIINSYNELEAQGLIDDPYPPLRNDDIMQRLLVGRADLKMVAWRKKNAQVKDLNTDEKYMILYNDFLIKEIKRLTGNNIQLDIFKDFNATIDEFDRLQKEVNLEIDYKY